MNSHVFRTVSRLVAGSALTALAAGAQAQFVPGSLVVSRIEYKGNLTNFSDPNFPGVTGPVFLDSFSTHGGPRLSTLALPSSTSSNNGIVSSFSSKSEGALMRSVDGQYLTYIGYQAAVGITSIPGAPGTGVSNSYTTGAFPPGDTSAHYDRVVARIGANGAKDVSTVLNNAYSGDNARAALTVDGAEFYTVGNATNADSTIGLRYSTLGAHTSTKLGTADPKVVKADNYRAVGIFNGNLYVAKGSGGKGNNGIFQAGTGVPTSLSTSTKDIIGLPGLSGGTSDSGFHPFGFFFANPTTLYVADEGVASVSGSTVTASSPFAGLDKYVLVNGTWKLEYVLTAGLNLNVLEPVTGFQTESATTGLRNLTGKVNADGTVSLYAITAQTSSLSGGEADPTELVSITDALSDTTSAQASAEAFNVLETSAPGEVFRGVAFAPTPEPGTVALCVSLGLSGALLWKRRRARK